MSLDDLNLITDDMSYRPGPVNEKLLSAQLNLKIR